MTAPHHPSRHERTYGLISRLQHSHIITLRIHSAYRPPAPAHDYSSMTLDLSAFTRCLIPMLSRAFRACNEVLPRPPAISLPQALPHALRIPTACGVRILTLLMRPWSIPVFAPVFIASPAIDALNARLNSSALLSFQIFDSLSAPSY